MPNRTILTMMGLVLIFGIGFLVYKNKKTIVLQEETSTLSTEILPEAQSPTSNTKTSIGSGLTLTQIASHNSRSSCWSAINGNVYDLTSWIPNHPGGEKAILSLCGIDGSSRYSSKHGNDAKPAKILSGFKIGTLAP